MTTRSTEFVSKKKDNFNVMVMRPNNHITLVRDHSYNLLTWSQHVTYKLHPDIKFIIDSTIRDIKSSLILWSASSFPCHDYILISFITATCVFSKFKKLAWALSSMFGGLQGKLLSGQRFIQIPVVVAWEEYPWSLLMKATDGSQSEWWAERLAGRSISPTLEDVNINFNHPPYYLMNKVVTVK